MLSKEKFVKIADVFISLLENIKIGFGQFSIDIGKVIYDLSQPLKENYKKNMQNIVRNYQCYMYM